jgi:ATP-binding cassette, subfamily B, bacterial
MEKEKRINKSEIKNMLGNGWRLLRMSYSARPALVLGSFALFFAAAVATFASSGVQALLINALVKVAGVGTWSKEITLLLVSVIAISLLPEILWRLRDYWRWVLWFTLEEKYNLLVLRQRSVLDVAVHEDPNTQNLFQRVNEAGVWRMENFLDRTFYMLQNFLEIVVASFVLLSFKWWICAIVVLGMIPDLIVAGSYSRDSYGIDFAKGDVKRRFWDLQNRFKTLSDIVEIKLFSLAENFIGRVSSLFRTFRGPEETTEKRKFRAGTLASLFSRAGEAVALAWAINEVLAGRMQIGTLTFVFTSIYALQRALSGLLQNIASQYKDSFYLTDIFKFLDLKPMIDMRRNTVALAADITPSIKFENVSFAYAGSSEPVLKDISLEIPAGEKLAIVGVNGAGKTTLIKLLCRFYDPTSGRILVGEKDLREISLESWYAHLGAIFQDYSKYNFVVKESIAISTPGDRPIIDKVKESAKSAEADVFIEEWQKGYDQMLGKEFEGGIEPSVGQWQKLALARTFYRDPRILILDEPTSSIDAEAEAKIFDKLEQLASDRTVILISHRFSTVRHAHKIVVIENGTISEEGTHERLLAKNKTYARLFRLQAKGYE